MKRIIAFIKPIMLDDVIFALHDLEGFHGANISEVQRIGCGKCDHEKHADRMPLHRFPKSIRMEIVCADMQVEEIVEAIRVRAHTGLPDDGKIYVSTVDDAVCVRTGKRGNDAI